MDGGNGTTCSCGLCDAISRERDIWKRAFELACEENGAYSSVDKFARGAYLAHYFNKARAELEKGEAQ